MIARVWGMAEYRLIVDLDQEQVEPRSSSYPAYPGDFSSLLFPHPRKRQEIYSLEKMNQRERLCTQEQQVQVKAGGRAVPQVRSSENLDYTHWDLPNSFPM